MGTESKEQTKSTQTVTGVPREDFQTAFAKPLAWDAERIRELDSSIKKWTIELKKTSDHETQVVGPLWIRIFEDEKVLLQMGELLMEMIWNLSAKLIPDYVSRLVEDVKPSAAEIAKTTAQNKISDFTLYMLTELKKAKEKQQSPPEPPKEN